MASQDSVVKRGQQPNVGDSPSSRKTSIKEGVKEDAAAQGQILKPQPSLRKKAFCKQRQDTFHSLNMDVAGHSSSCPPEEEMLQRAESERGDYLRMPSIDSMRISGDTPPRKPSAPTRHSNPTMKGVEGSATKKLSLDSSTDSTSLSPSNTAAASEKRARGGKKVATKPRLVLHTIEQPDGGVIGFCTEEENQATSTS